VSGLAGRPALALLGGKLTRDIGYSLGSFAVLALSGLVINLVITWLRDAAALGVFNQSYAVYILISQIATFGLHYSVLRYSAVHDSDANERGQVLLNAAACALLGGFATAGLTIMCEPLFARAFDSPATAAAIRNAAVGLCLFPLNKVLLAHLNALRHMRAYSLLQAGRYTTIMVLVAVLCTTALPIETATFAFFAAEVVTAIAAVLYLRAQGELSRLAFSRSWTRTHLRFGGKALVAGTFAEFNSRVDVLVIGFFMADRAVGIYSFAAMLADGLYHVLAMVRLNFNPLLVRVLRDRDWEQARNLLRRTRRLAYPAVAVLSTLVILAFWTFTVQVMPQKGLVEGLPSLVILLSTLTLVSSFVPFDNLLLVTGHPGYQTLQQFATVLSNATFGILLLPWFGIAGVAAGTAASYLVAAVALVVMARRVVGWNLLTNSFRH
jgi:O-antigen/teichoic acid export membrane protein